MLQHGCSRSVGNHSHRDTASHPIHPSVALVVLLPPLDLASLRKRLHSSLCSADLFNPRFPRICDVSLWMTPSHLVLGFPTGLVLWHFPLRNFLAYYAWPRTPSTKVTRKERNPWHQHVHRTTHPRSYAIDKVWEAVTSRCLGNGWSDASCKQYGGVSASYKQFSVSASYKQYVSDECTYNIQSRQKHNMLSFLHAACLKLFYVVFSSAQKQKSCGF